MTQKISFEISDTALDISTKKLLKEAVKEKLFAVDLPGIVTYKEILGNVLNRRKHVYAFNLLVRVFIKSRKSLKREEAYIVGECCGLYGVDVFQALRGVKFSSEEDFQYEGVKWRVVVYKIDIQRERD